MYKRGGGSECHAVQVLNAIAERVGLAKAAGAQGPALAGPVLQKLGGAALREMARLRLSPKAFLEGIPEWANLRDT